MTEQALVLNKSNLPPIVLSHAPSLQNPQLDLLTPSSSYTCHSCSLPLGAFTRVLAKEGDGKGFRNYCLGCFAGWSKSPRPLPSPSSKEYEYIVIEGSNGEWGQMETIALFECVQEFGMSSWENVRREFNRRMGQQRIEMELAHRFNQFYNGDNPDFSLRSLYGPKGIPYPEMEKTPKPPHIFDRTNPDDQIRLRFQRMLQMNGVLTYQHYPNDDHYAYLVSLLADRASRNGGERIPTPLQLEYGLKWSEESVHFIQEQTNALDSLMRLFMTAHKRQSRQGRRLLGVSQDSPDFLGDDVDDYLETAGLNKIEGMPALIEALWEVRQRREQLRGRQRKERADKEREAKKGKNKKKKTSAPKKRPPKKQAARRK